MKEIEIYSPEEVKEKFKYLVEKDFIVDGTPTGLYADRASYGNRPTLAIVLNNILLCQAFSQKISERFFNTEVMETLDRLWGEQPIKWLPEWNNEYLATAAACVDDHIRKGTSVRLIGKLRDDAIFEFYGLKTRLYSFALSQNNVV